MGFTFSEKSAAKVVEATKIVLGTPVDGHGDTGRNRSYRDLFFWAVLSSETGAVGSYSYSFVESLRNGTTITNGRSTASLSAYATTIAGDRCTGTVLIRMAFSGATPTFTIVTPQASTIPNGLKKYMVYQMTSDATVVSGVITVPGTTAWDYALAHS